MRSCVEGEDQTRHRPGTPKDAQLKLPTDPATDFKRFLQDPLRHQNIIQQYSA